MKNDIILTEWVKYFKELFIQESEEFNEEEISKVINNVVSEKNEDTTPEEMY